MVVGGAYPKYGVVTANEIHIPAGTPDGDSARSADVLHEFWVAQLTRKMATVPDHPNHIWIQSDQPGTYLGVCSEFCGTQHAWMHFLVVAETPEQFAAVGAGAVGAGENSGDRRLPHWVSRFFKKIAA